jgi:protein-disulfide isomerase
MKGDKYWQYHTKLMMTRGQIGKAQALAVAKEMGADMDRLAKDTASPETRASLQEVMMIADKLQLTGTPTFVLGDEVIVGAVGQDELRTRIGNMRKCGKTACG